MQFLKSVITRTISSFSKMVFKKTKPSDSFSSHLSRVEKAWHIRQSVNEQFISNYRAQLKKTNL